jgi:hypothetical protein
MSTKTDQEFDVTGETDVTDVEEFTVPELVLDQLAADKKHARFAAQATEEVVNPMVLADVLEVRPQMIYNYIRKGKIASVTSNNTQKKVIPLSAARVFARQYLQRKVDQQTKQQVQDELTAAAEVE